MQYVINVHIIFLYLAKILKVVVLVKVKSGSPTNLFTQKYKLTKVKNKKDRKLSGKERKK